jgi:hypothetical protein
MCKMSTFQGSERLAASPYPVGDNAVSGGSRVSSETMLSAKSFRYLKLGLALCIGSTAGYIWHSPSHGPGGGTWLGYTLGTIGALLILWLLLLGVRKRSYRAQVGTLRGWVSAHVYLGLSLLVITTLHAGLDFDWFVPTVHLAAYGLMLAVIVSGIWGVVAYRRYPIRLSDLLGGYTLDERLDELGQLDREARQVAAGLGAHYPALIERSAAAPLVRGLLGRFQRRASGCPTAAAVDELRVASLAGDLIVRRLFTLQARRQQQLQRIREFLRLKAWTDLWLVLHVPLSFGLLAALIAHVVAVFIYW